MDNAKIEGQTLMIVGYGSVGQYLLDMILTQTPQRFSRVVIVSRKSEYEVAPRLNTSIVSGMIKGSKVSVIYKSCDIKNTEKLRDILNEYTPSLLFQCARFFSGVKYGSFSYRRGIGYGVWSPMSVIPIFYVMKAVRESCISDSVQVVNTSYPDATNAWIESDGRLPYPLTGVGNVSHLIPRIKLALGSLKSIYPCLRSSSDSEIELYCTHYTNTYVSKEGDAKGDGYALVIDGEFVSPYISKSIFKECKIPMESGSVRNLMVASDCYKIASIGTNEEVLHLPGALGHIGGEPYKVSLNERRDRLVITPVNRLSSSSIYSPITSMLKEGLALDGVDSIYEGNLYFTDKVIDQMKKEFDIDYPKMINLWDAEEFAQEIMSKLMEIKD